MEDYASMYRALHARDKYFPGHSIKEGVDQIVKLVEAHAPRRLLDYGCGKGKQYFEGKVHQRWGGMFPFCYDVGVERFSKRPGGSFDGVICTDVMEHIAEPDINAILDDIFGFLPPRNDGGTSFAFFWISCRPARRKTLPDGRNVHLTVRSPEWWDERFKRFNRDRLVIQVGYDQDAP